MIHEQPVPATPALLGESEPSIPFITVRYRIALEHLCRAFKEPRSLAVLTGGWTSGASHLIRNFLAGVESDAAVVRIDKSCTDALDGMRSVIQATGFEPNDMSLADLESMFTKFLSFQRDHRCRTICLIEETRDNGDWVCDKVCQFVELETQYKFGLMVILVRQSDLNAPINEPALDAVCTQAGKRIDLVPFTVADTREYIRWRIDASASADISRIFDFHAITLIHELCAGIPDAVNALCCTSINMAEEEDVAPVTTDLVVRASQRLRMPPRLQPSVAEVRPVNGKAVPVAEDDSNVPFRFILTRNGRIQRELSMKKEQLTIGRATDNDLCISSRYVSRHHAVIDLQDGEIVVKNLDSKNGTFVNYRPVSDRVVMHRDIISIGRHRIKVIDSNASDIQTRQDVEINGMMTVRSLETTGNGLASIKTPALSAATTFRKAAADPE